jgi:organic hydroperoxide reductase OsmC/OhrA
LEGELTILETNQRIRVATPKAFGGDESQWSPEHLFLGSISSCYMTTYLFFCRKYVCNISGFTCNIIGHVEMIDGKLRFTHIDIYPKVYVVDEPAKVKVRSALEKTQQYCLISNSVKAEITYHTEVLTATQTVKQQPEHQ